MSLSLAAIAPHSPLLLPTVGRQNFGRQQATIRACAQISADVAAKKIETVIIISPLTLPGATFTLNAPEKFEVGFEEFGDFATKFTAKSNITLAHQLQLALTEKNYSLQLTSEPKLDYASGVVLYNLHQLNPKIKILPLFPGTLELSDIFAFGQALKKELEMSPKKIALIGAGCLSQRLAKDSPLGYSKAAKNFDKKIIKHLETKKTAEILKITAEEREEAKELCLPAAAIILGAMDGVNYTNKMLCYESPFGSGLLTWEFGV